MSASHFSYLLLPSQRQLVISPINLSDFFAKVYWADLGQSTIKMFSLSRTQNVQRGGIQNVGWPFKEVLRSPRFDQRLNGFPLYPDNCVLSNFIFGNKKGVFFFRSIVLLGSKDTIGGDVDAISKKLVPLGTAKPAQLHKRGTWLQLIQCCTYLFESRMSSTLYTRDICSHFWNVCVPWKLVFLVIHKCTWNDAPWTTAGLVTKLLLGTEIHHLSR